MSSQISFLTQSRFYSPAFNSAIFDGPLRIYFAQYQEPIALKIYFMAQQKMAGQALSLREVYRRVGVNIFVMLYPSAEAFQMSFEQNSGELVHIDRLGTDFVVGVSGPISETQIETICERIQELAKVLIEMNPPTINDPEVESALAL